MLKSVCKWCINKYSKDPWIQNDDARWMRSRIQCPYVFTDVFFEYIKKHPPSSCPHALLHLTQGED